MEDNNIQELLQLKEQMIVLKKQLNNNTIINNERIISVTKIHNPRNKRKKWIWGILIGATITSNIFPSMVNVNGIWLKISLALIGIFGLITYSALVFGAGDKYYIENGLLIVKNCFLLLGKHIVVSIPISSIRYVRIMKKTTIKHSLEICYNKYDMYCIDPKDINKLIYDLTCINPEIEIRHK